MSRWTSQEAFEENVRSGAITKSQIKVYNVIKDFGPPFSKLDQFYSAIENCGVSIPELAERVSLFRHKTEYNVLYRSLIGETLHNELLAASKTTQEIFHITRDWANPPINGVTPRPSELIAKGVVIEIGARPCTHTGRLCLMRIITNHLAIKLPKKPSPLVAADKKIRLLEQEILRLRDENAVLKGEEPKGLPPRNGKYEDLFEGEAL